MDYGIIDRSADGTGVPFIPLFRRDTAVISNEFFSQMVKLKSAHARLYCFFKHREYPQSDGWLRQSSLSLPVCG